MGSRGIRESLLFFVVLLFATPMLLFAEVLFETPPGNSTLGGFSAGSPRVFTQQALFPVSNFTCDTLPNWTIDEIDFRLGKNGIGTGEYKAALWFSNATGTPDIVSTNTITIGAFAPVATRTATFNSVNIRDACRTYSQGGMSRGGRASHLMFWGVRGVSGTGHEQGYVASNHMGALAPSVYAANSTFVADNWTFTTQVRGYLEPECAENCFSNVLFLPGIESSRLYRPDYNGGEDKLWEPLHNDDVHDLFMTSGGESLREDIYTKPGDVLDEISVGGANIYKSFIGAMDNLVDEGKIAEWASAPYDWRLSLDDILSRGADIDGRIYYAGTLGATSSPYIIQELRRLAATSKSGKVTIVAHSNGGLVAKRLTQILGTEATELIDTIMFVGVPQVGTPAAIAAGLHGYDQELAQGYVLSEETARAFAQNAPMFYQLIPSRAYFESVSSPVVSFEELPEWDERYGSTITSAASLNTFLTDSFGRVEPSDSVAQPLQLHSSLLNAADTLHQSIDSWTPPEGIELIQIAGWGVPKTVSGITYREGEGGVVPEPEFTIDGDGTVVVPSALWTSGVERYWVDLGAYNKENIFESGFGFNPFTHARILETSSTLSFISGVLVHNRQSVENYDFFSNLPPNPIKNTLRYSLHSPLMLDVYDEYGRHTGISTTTGQLEEHIPGTYYTEFGETKYIFTDAASTLRVIMDGYDTGTFTLEVEEFSGDTLVASTTWKDMPVTPETIVSLQGGENIDSLSSLRIDVDGDGDLELDLAPQKNGVVVVPKIPLTITAPSLSMQLRAPIPPLIAAITGLDEGDVDDIRGEPACTTGATGNEVGSYTITCTRGTLESEKYDFTTFIPGTLSVTYGWSGFLQPIDDPTANPSNTPSVFKAGSTVPVKFKLHDAHGVSAQASSSPLWLQPQKGAAMSAAIDESVYSAPASNGSGYRWDASAQHYIYNWSTKGSRGGYWYRVYAKLDDGKIYSVIVGLR